MGPDTGSDQQHDVGRSHRQRNLQDPRRISAVGVHVHASSVRGSGAGFKMTLPLPSPAEKAPARQERPPQRNPLLLQGARSAALLTVVRAVRLRIFIRQLQDLYLSAIFPERKT